jgi:hypothetical protein
MVEMNSGSQIRADTVTVTAFRTRAVTMTQSLALTSLKIESNALLKWTVAMAALPYFNVSNDPA